MELPIVRIHFAIIVHIFLPKVGILSNMEAADIGLVELLHLGNLQQTIIVMPNTIIPLRYKP
jgi:hypothetical protein